MAIAFLFEKYSDNTVRYATLSKKNIG